MNMPNKMYNQNLSRTLWLDIAKGLTIVLMVVGHTSIPDAFSRLIWAFHMPLFFIASGWMTSWRKYPITEFMVRKSRSIMLPFALYSIIVLCIYHFTSGTISFDSWIRYGWQGYALWFIPVLYLASLFGRIVHCFQNKYMRYVIMLLLIIMGDSLSYYNYVLPWSLSSVPYACFLVLIGTELKRLSSWIDKPRWWVACAGLVLAITISRFYRLDMCFNHILPILPLTIGAIAGTVMMFTISSYIANCTKYCSQIMQAIGKETYVVVAFSQITIVLINTYLTHNMFIKYSLLIVVLVTITYLKNCINRITKTKIL